MLGAVQRIVESAFESVRLEGFNDVDVVKNVGAIRAEHLFDIGWVEGFVTGPFGQNHERLPSAQRGGEHRLADARRSVDADLLVVHRGNLPG